MSKELATAKRDIPVELDLQTYVPEPTARSSATPSAPTSCASRCAGSRRRSARPTRPRPRPQVEQALTRARAQASLEDVKKLPRREVSIAVAPPRLPRTSCSPPTPAWRFGVHPGGAARCWSARSRDPRTWSRRSAPPRGRPRRQVARRSAGERSRTTPRSRAYLLEPARRAYPFRELTEERGFGAEVDDETGADALLLSALAAWQREEIRGARADRPDERRRAAAGPACCAKWSRPARSSTPSAWRDLHARQGRGGRSSSARSSSCPGRSSRSARPSSSRRSCSASSGCRASAAARPATRPTRACSRRSATSTR